MNTQDIIKMFSGRIITDSKLNNDTKLQMLNYVKEANVYEVMALLLDGKIQTISEESKSVVLERFKKSDIPEKIKIFTKQEIKK